ncbi:MAG: hypothetical protein A3K67_03625, partial [Euryarchaeota archaeon RBG_16_62_10]
MAVGSGAYAVSDDIELVEGGAAHLLDENALVVADMHLGCEAALEYEGLSLPRVQSRKIEGYVLDVIDRIGPSRVVVAGDLKHNFSRNLAQEWRDVSRFVELLAGRAPLEVVKGNHDNYLSIILKERGLPLKREARVGRFRILHGHEGRSLRGPTVMGHIHPSIRLKDRLGAGVKDPCFLWSERKEVLVLPALSIVASGADVV